MLQTVALPAAAVWIYTSLWFFVALARKDNSVADIAWGPGFVLVAVLTLFRQGPLHPRPVLVSGLVLVWGLRLSFHIARRNWRRGEDPRYATWRKEWGKWFVPRSYAQVFILQGVFLLVISSPVLFINTLSGPGIGVLDLAGAAVWISGFLFEAVADAQLKRFKGNPENRGKIMTEGLWKATRHPNYFGEAVMWWGIFIMALAVPGAWPTAAGPLLITFLLTRVSGVPLLEKRYAGNPAFEDYAKRTPAFVPWFPKKDRGRPRGASH